MAAITVSGPARPIHPLHAILLAFPVALFVAGVDTTLEIPEGFPVVISTTSGDVSVRDVAEGVLTISSGSCSAKASASAVLPAAVGPSRASAGGGVDCGMRLPEKEINIPALCFR